MLRQLFPESVPGLTTWAQPKQAVYLKDNLSGETVQVGVFDGSLPGPGNQMVPLQNGFVSFGVPMLLKCMDADSQWVTVDEIGYLEGMCEPYHKVLRELLEQKQVAAVVRKQDLPFLKELCSRDDAFVVDLDQPFGNVGCVIMASGLGRRFGGNKLMADFQGKPLISHILDATEGIFSQRVVVTRHEDVADLCRNRNIQTVLHSQPYRSDTVRLGLEAMPGIRSCMFCPGDQPLLRRETICALVLAAVNREDAIWRTVWKDTPGSPVVFPGWTFPELRTLPKGKGGGVIVQRYPEYLRVVNVCHQYELKDVDSAQDLEELLKR